MKRPKNPAETRLVVVLPRRRIYGNTECTSAFDAVVGGLEFHEIEAQVVQQSARQARRERHSADLLAMLELLCDGACWSLSGKRAHIADVPAKKIQAARRLVAKVRQ